MFETYIYIYLIYMYIFFKAEMCIQELFESLSSDSINLCLLMSRNSLKLTKPKSISLLGSFLKSINYVWVALFQN